MNSPNAEIQENRAMHLSVYDLLANKLFLLGIISVIYLFCVLIGLNKAHYLADSSLIKLFSNILGPCAAIFCGSIAYIIAFIIPHKYEFAREVYSLSDNLEFNIAISLIFLLFPVASFIARTINRAITSFILRKYIFIISITILLIQVYLINNILSNFNNKPSFVFGFTLFGIIYYVVFACVSNDYRARIQRMRNI
ncbi:MAG: hypothetical protein ACYC25_08960 [Paludibacter sp.]